MTSIGSIIVVFLALMFIGCVACMKLYVDLSKDSRTVYPI